MSSTILDQFGTPWKYAHAADRSTLRGVQFQTRNDDIFKLINTSDRLTLAGLSSRLYANFGVLKGAINQKADYVVGEAWLPHYDGVSDFDDGKAIAKFLADVWLPQCDVRGGMHDWWRMLETTSIAMDRDGDVFWMFVVGSDGFPRLQQIPQHRVSGDGIQGRVEEKGPFYGYRIRDGIVYYASGRPTAYRVNFGESEKPDYRIVPASDIVHFFDSNYSEQGRGLPLFTHALEDFKTCLSSTSDERKRQELISRLYLTIFNQTGGPNIDDPAAILNGSSATSGYTTEPIQGGIMYLPSNSGDKIEQVTHENPGDVWEAFQDRLIRNALAGAGWPYSLWKPAGQGTAERADVLKARRSVTRRQKQLFYGARRAMAWAYSVFQQQNRVPILDHPFSWRFSRPPRLSVDDGRESRLELEEWITGSRNLDEIVGSRGLDEEEFLTRRAWSVAKRKAIARKVSEEATGLYGYEIEVEDREMCLLNPNEQPKPEAPEPTEPAKTKPKSNDDEDPND